MVSKNADSWRVSGLQILRFKAADPLAVAMPRIPSHDDDIELAEDTNPFNLEPMDMGDAAEPPAPPPLWLPRAQGQEDDHEVSGPTVADEGNQGIFQRKSKRETDRTRTLAITSSHRVHTYPYPQDDWQKFRGISPFHTSPQPTRGTTEPPALYFNAEPHKCHHEDPRPIINR